MTRRTTQAGRIPSSPPSRPRRWIPDLPPAWAALAPLLETSAGRALDRRLATAEGPVYPPRGRVFRALRLTPPEAVRAVILGQDPYHGPGQADGLAFSVAPGTALPPSLRNIRRELQTDLGEDLPESGDLAGWARGGVLLLNAVLTVSDGAPAGHAGWGWEAFTDAVLRHVAEAGRPVAYLLWGRYARRKALVLEGVESALRIETTHPSPLSASRGFLGSACFSRANRALEDRGAKPLAWGRLLREPHREIAPEGPSSAARG